MRAVNRTGEGVRLSLVSECRVLHILVHHILSPPECSIVGGDNQNYMSYQPSKRTGYIYYPYPIPCTGIITTFTASGFCIVNGRTDQNVSLRLKIVTSTQSDKAFHQVKNMAAECGNSTMNSSSGIEYSFGTVFRESLNIPVSSGDYLGFEFTCSEKHCFFQTAIVNDTGKNLYDGEKKPLSNVSLLFSATISETSGMFI